MSVVKSLSLGAVIVLAATAAKAEATVSTQGSFDTVMASMPVAPSVVFFIGGIVGLAFLARRKARKAKPLY